MHHGFGCPFPDGLLYCVAIRDEHHPCDPSLGPSLADYNPAGCLGMAKELVAGLDRFGH